MKNIVFFICFIASQTMGHTLLAQESPFVVGIAPYLFGVEFSETGIDPDDTLPDEDFRSVYAPDVGKVEFGGIAFDVSLNFVRKDAFSNLTLNNVSLIFDHQYDSECEKYFVATKRYVDSFEWSEIKSILDPRFFPDRKEFQYSKDTPDALITASLGVGPPRGGGCRVVLSLDEPFRISDFLRGIDPSLLESQTKE